MYTQNWPLSRLRQPNFLCTCTNLTTIFWAFWRWTWPEDGQKVDSETLTVAIGTIGTRQCGRSGLSSQSAQSTHWPEGGQWDLPSQSAQSARVDVDCQVYRRNRHNRRIGQKVELFRENFAEVTMKDLPVIWTTERFTPVFRNRYHSRHQEIMRYISVRWHGPEQ